MKSDKRATSSFGLGSGLLTAAQGFGAASDSRCPIVIGSSADRGSCDAPQRSLQVRASRLSANRSATNPEKVDVREQRQQAQNGDDLELQLFVARDARAARSQPEKHDTEPEYGREILRPW